MSAATATLAPRQRISIGSAPRLLRIELRRSPMPLILPVVAALFWFDSYRPSTSQPPFWILRTFWNMGQGHTIIDFGPLVAGMAAWIASRDGRRGISDLVTALSAPAWKRHLAAWGAAAIWAVGGYVVFVGVLFGVYATQDLKGTPPWWWAAVGASAVAAFSAAGFAVGTLVTSRYAAPLATVGALIVMMFSSQIGFSHTSGSALILPTNSNGNYQPPTSIFDPYLPDLPIARIVLFAGVTVAVLGLIGLSSGGSTRTIAIVVTACGVLAAGTAIGLAGTARLAPNGTVIPALHDGANDRPIAYTPVCDRSAPVPVCVNPAYRQYLPDLTAALGPALVTMSGLPGAPVLANQTAGAYESRQGGGGQVLTIAGSPPVLAIPLDAEGLPGSFGWTDRELSDDLRLMAVHAFLGAPQSVGTPAQVAVQSALLDLSGVPFASQTTGLDAYGMPWWAKTVSSDTPAVAAAAQHLAALPLPSRTVWLMNNLPALRAGTLSLTELP